MPTAFSAAFRLCDPGKVHQHLLVHLWKDLPRFWLTPQNRLTPQQFSGNHISWKLWYLRNILILHVLGLSFQGKCLNLPTSTEPNKPDKHTLKFFPNQDGNLWNPNSTKILSPTTGFGAAKPEPDKVKPYSLILPLCPRFFWYPNHPKSILDLWFHKFNKKVHNYASLNWQSPAFRVCAYQVLGNQAFKRNIFSHQVHFWSDKNVWETWM